MEGGHPEADIQSIALHGWLCLSASSDGVVKLWDLSRPGITCSSHTGHTGMTTNSSNAGVTTSSSNAGCTADTRAPCVGELRVFTTDWRATGADITVQHAGTY